MAFFVKASIFIMIMSIMLLFVVEPKSLEQTLLYATLVMSIIVLIAVAIKEKINRF